MPLAVGMGLTLNLRRCGFKGYERAPRCELSSLKRVIGVQESDDEGHNRP